MIGVMSDSHDNVDAVRAAVEVFKSAGCKLVIHAGDFVAPFAARRITASGTGHRVFRIRRRTDCPDSFNSLKTALVARAVTP